MSAEVTAAAIREHLAADDLDWVWRTLLQGRDHLALIFTEYNARPELLAMWEQAPASTGSREWDALLATLVAHEFEEAGHAAPVWAETFPPLDEPWLPEHPFLDDDRVRAQTPEWLRRRNIFVPARDLLTA